MQELAATLRDNLDTLAEEYEQLLRGIADYARMPDQDRHDAAQSAIQLVAAGLEAGDQDQFIQFIQAISVERVTQGFEIESVQQALTALVEIVEPMLDTVETASFLWRAVLQAHTALSQMAMKRARTVEEQFGFIADNITVGVFLHQDGIMRYIGREGARILGYDDPDELTGRLILDIVHPSERERIADIARRRAAGEPIPGQYESRFIRKDGSPIDVWLNNALIEYEGRTATQGVFVDITERKQAEQALEGQRAFLRQVIDLTPNFVFVKDREGRFVLVNQALAETYGTTVDGLVGKSDADFNPNPEEVEHFRRDDLQVMDSLQEKFIPEEVITDATGSVRWLQTIKRPLVDQDGVARRILGVSSDITVRKQAEQALEEQRAFLRQVIDLTPNFVFVKDREGRFVLVNQALAETYGTTVDGLVGKSDADFNPNPEEVEHFRRDDLQVMDSLQEKFIPEEVITDATGNVRWLQTIKRPLVDQDGVARRILGVSSDITARKELEQTIQESLERRGRLVQTSTEVAQEIAAAPALDELYRRVVTLIKERFGYYHAQIFRYEPALDAVVLVTSYGEAGKALLAAGHRLVMGRGVVGTAAATARPVLATDVAQDEDWVPNPHLPETQGELAVPIKWRDDVMGVLDVQSDRAGALTEDDQLLLESLCSQIAIAIEDTRLRQEMEENLRELEHLTRAMSRKGWETMRREAGPTGYLFDQTGVIPVGDFWAPEIGLAVERKSLVPPVSGDRPMAVAPLSAGGEIIGALGVQDDPQHPLSRDDLALVEAVADQVAQALESARLFEQTQAMLAETETLYQGSERVVHATTIDGVLQALIDSTALQRLDRVPFLFFDRPLSPDERPDVFTVAAVWERGGAEPRAPVGTRYDFDQLSSMRRLTSQEPVIVRDVAADEYLDENARDLLIERLGVQGITFWPLMAGQQWIGFLSGESNAVLDLSEGEIRQITALTGQAATVIQGLRLVEQAQARARREQALREITAAVSTSEDLDDLVARLPAIAEPLRRLVPVDMLSVATYVPGEFEFTLFAIIAEPEADHTVQQGVRVSLEGTGPGWVITHQEPWLEADVREEMLFAGDDQLVARGIVARLILPLQFGGQVVGTLNLGSTRVGAFTEEHLPLLRQVADQVAQALERARLLQETRSALAETEATHRAYLRRGWRDYLRQQETLRQGAFLYDRTPGAAALDGLVEPVADLWRPEMGRALTAGLTATVEDSSDEGKRTGLAIPITLRGQTIGVLGVEDPAGEHRWSEDDRAVIEAVSRQLAQALENARLLGETQLRAQREQIIGDITSRVRASMDLENILRTTVRELGIALGTDRAFIQLSPGAQPSEE